ncbi:glycosyltransferase family 4 protein [Halobacterium sp. KA-4]|uniref:glycosyltransferase family 4 protein n=1 Tax=Halobacterium sp. KA-4 TaxID=2896367 RepID=UPI001E31290D|nr:glycosyltransferase family 4 protein [Halobacterium sp. KA-4]MCD2200488.1 glycosyltransferase family 4 protein [Halobacterium sp. KA-4]
MKIGFFAYSLSGTGPRTRARTLIEALANRTDHDLVVVTGPSEDYDHPRVERHRINAVPIGLLTGAPTVRRAFTDVDVVHVPVNIYQIAYVRAIYHGPLVSGAGVQHTFPYRTLAKYLGIDQVIETHEYVAYLWERSGFKSDYIYPAVNAENFYEYETDEREAVRDRLGIPSENDVVLFVGSLTEFKGAHLISRLARRLENDDVTVIVAGEGSLRERFEGRPNIIYEGFVDNENLPPLYNVADVTLVPSKSESFSIVSVESAACGTPVITTTQEGTMIRLFRERQAYRWAERSVDGLLNAVCDLLNNPDEHRTQAERGHEAVEEMGLTIADTVDQHLKAYRAAIENH